MRHLCRKGKRQGTALVEFAIVVVLLVLLLIGIISFGLMFKDLLVLQGAAKVGGRSAALGETTDTIVTKIKNAAPSLERGLISVEMKYSTDGGSTFPYTLGNFMGKNNAPVGSLIRIKVFDIHRHLARFVLPHGFLPEGEVARPLVAEVIVRREG